MAIACMLFENAPNARIVASMLSLPICCISSKFLTIALPLPAAFADRVWMLTRSGRCAGLAFAYCVAQAAAPDWPLHIALHKKVKTYFAPQYRPPSRRYLTVLQWPLT